MGMEASPTINGAPALPVQGHGPHRVAGLYVEELRGRVCKTYTMPTDLHRGGVEAIRLRVAEQDRLICGSGWQIQADQAAATLDGLHLLQSRTVMRAAIERINGVEIPEARPLQQVEHRHRGWAHLSHDLLRLWRQELEHDLVPGKEGLDKFFVRPA